MMELSNISKSYGDNLVLDDLTVSLSQGKIISLVGPNGVGKSTLLKCMALLETPDKGTINTQFGMFKFPINDVIRTKDYWPDVTMVFQQFHLWPHLTTNENLILPLKNRFPQNYNDVLTETLERFNLTEIKNQKASELSVGQQQSVAIARAISLKPQIILLDEITSALDILNANRINTILNDEKERGALIILVTHSINYAIKTADEYIVLEKGKITEQENISNILSPKSQYLKECLTNKGYLL